MNPQLRRFAPLGLYLALLAALVAAGLYIVQREWNFPLQLSLALIVIGLALFAALDPGRVRTALSGRQARYGSNALVLTVAFVGILIALNYLAYTNAKDIDLTEDQAFTLAPETVNTLQSLPDTVKATLFYPNALISQSPERFQSVEDRLKLFQEESGGKFTYEVVDPYENPGLAEAAKITNAQSLVLSMNGQQRVVDNLNDESGITSALVYLIDPEPRTVYFLTGHGEADPQGSGDNAYSFASRTLESKNYTVAPLNLFNSPQVPADASVVIIAGPQKSLTQPEVDALDQYLAGGGSLIVMEEPTLVTQLEGQPDLLAGYLQTQWGVTLQDNLIIDPGMQIQTFTTGNADPSHKITADLGGYVSIFYTARGLSVQEAPQGVSQQALLTTSTQAWGETNFEGLQAETPDVQQDAEADQSGPLSLAVAVEHFETDGRLVVFGDMDFASNGLIGQGGNSSLFTNAVDWAAGEEQLINLTPRNATQRQLTLPPQRIWVNLILFAAVFVLPGLVLLAGIVVFIQRRRRG